MSEKFRIVLQLAAIYRALRVKYGDELNESIMQAIGVVRRVCLSNEKQFFELVVVERIDEILVLSLKSYPSAEH